MASLFRLFKVPALNFLTAFFGAATLFVLSPTVGSAQSDLNRSINSEKNSEKSQLGVASIRGGVARVCPTVGSDPTSEKGNKNRTRRVRLSGKVDSHLINVRNVSSVLVLRGSAAPREKGLCDRLVFEAPIVQQSASCLFSYSAPSLLPYEKYTVVLASRIRNSTESGSSVIRIVKYSSISTGRNSTTVLDFDAPKVIQVGPGRAVKLPSAAAAIAKDGDVIEIDSGTYPADVAHWTASNLTLRGIGSSFVHLKAEGKSSQDKATWVVAGNKVRIENIEFSGAKSPGRNGAGIRAEGSDLTICHSFFHHNENGILGKASGVMVVEFSEFSENGYGDGQSHNLYIVGGESLIFRHNYSHSARIGHNLKSRAKRNIVEYNKIVDGALGASSYLIDIPNGGHAVIVGNSLQQGPHTDNPNMVSYGAEGLLDDGSTNIFISVNNTFVSDLSVAERFIALHRDTDEATILNNLFVGAARVPLGLHSSNLVTKHPEFRDRVRLDYRLLPNSPAINRGQPPILSSGELLLPVWHYADPVTRTTRAITDAIDVGAFEFGR